MAPRLYEHRDCGLLFDPVLRCSVCGGAVTARKVRVRDGPGAAPAAANDAVAAKPPRQRAAINKPRSAEAAKVARSSLSIGGHSRSA